MSARSRSRVLSAAAVLFMMGSDLVGDEPKKMEAIDVTLIDPVVAFSFGENDSNMFAPWPNFPAEIISIVSAIIGRTGPPSHSFLSSRFDESFLSTQQG